jgi:thiol:disulfide interchange protein DsbD
MKFLFTTLITILLGLTSLHAQNSVSLQIQAERLTDTSGILKIQLKGTDSTSFFAAKQTANNNPFTAQLHLSGIDSQMVVLHKVKTLGTPIFQKDAMGNSLTPYMDSVTFIYPLHLTKDSTTLKTSFVWLGKKGDDYPSNEEKVKVIIPAGNGNTLTDNGSDGKSQSLWTIFVLTFGAGLLAIITPCVFPLIPVTVSFFLKRRKSRAEGVRNSVWYSISIIAIYTIPTLLLTLIFGDTILYTISSAAITILFFFAIFIVFAISFFGVFELNLPSSWANKANQKAGKGG